MSLATETPSSSWLPWRMGTARTQPSAWLVVTPRAEPMLGIEPLRGLAVEATVFIQVGQISEQCQRGFVLIAFSIIGPGTVTEGSVFSASFM